MASKKDPLRVVNLSNSPVRINYDSRGLKKLIMLPDYSPGKGLGPGTVAVFDSELHKPDLSYLGQDIGCGMLLARFIKKPEDLYKKIDSLYSALESYDPQWKELGRGNHFINVYESLPKNDDLYVLIHTGNTLNKKINSSDTGNMVLHDSLLNSAKLKRLEICRKVKAHFNADLDVLLDRPHNFIEFDPGRVIYRKGCVKVPEGDSAVIPSSCDGDALFVRVNQKISQLENSVCHGTGRIAPTGESKDFPDEYRDLKMVSEKLNDYFTEQMILRPLGREKQYIERMERQIAAEVAAMGDLEFETALLRATEGARNYISSLKGSAHIIGYGKPDSGTAQIQTLAQACSTILYLKPRIISRKLDNLKKNINSKQKISLDPYDILEIALRNEYLLKRTIK